MTLDEGSADELTAQLMISPDAISEAVRRGLISFKKHRQARQTQALEKIANTARQPPYNPYTASGGVPPQEMNANQQGSVTFIPDAAGSQWGTIWGPNGVQRVEKTSDGGFRIWP
jgi:hypothetical protein